MTLLVRLKCRGNAVQFKERKRGRKTEKEENKTTQKLLKLKNYAVYNTFLLSCYLLLRKVIDEQGCNPSCLNEYKYTPLHCAAMSGSMNVVKFLTVKKRCDPMCRQTTPLHRAALSGQLEVVKLLTFKMHCDPMSRNSKNDTTINPAIQNGHLNILKFFIFNRNCDPHIPVSQ